jgi:ribonuclease P protein 1
MGNGSKEMKRAKLYTSYMCKSPNVVIDFQFENKFDQRTELVKSLYRQITDIVKENREAADPLNIHFCNYNYDREYHQKYSSIVNYDANFIFETPNSYLDLFPKEKLIYLTRDAKRVMHSYDPNRIYIIGAIIDNKTDLCRFATYAQAKKEGIATESLPLDHYIE